MARALRILTLNVHGWHNEDDSFAALGELLCGANVDIIALQEATKHRLPALVRRLGSGWSCSVTYRNCCILTLHPHRSTQKHPPVRGCIARVQPAGWPEIEVCCLHFDHVREPTRLAEVRKLAEHLAALASPCEHRVFLGDFNALTQTDVAADGWRAIAEHRAQNAWEAPTSDLTDVLKAAPTKKRAGLRMVDARQAASERSGPLGTSRFGTRIDYVFLSASLAYSAAEVSRLDHLTCIPHVSDHNAVVATLELRASAPPPPLASPAQPASAAAAAAALPAAGGEWDEQSSPAGPTMQLARLYDAPQHLDAAARLLALEWPTQGVTSRRSALAAHLRQHAKRASERVPCHLLLLAEEVVAHCRLSPTCDNADGFSAAITSFVVHPSRRGLGLGRALLCHAEEEAAAAGFGYLYLWTHDAQGFYLACGYRECERVALLKPVISKMGSAAVSKLEALLAGKAAAAAAAASDGGGGGASSEAVVREDSTWMRKRLLEQCASAPLTREEILASSAQALQARSGKTGWAARLAEVRWERQVGPCCGLVALRMARSALRRGGEAPLSDAQSPAGWAIELSLRGRAGVSADASLLAEATARGFSSDGEVFDISQLAELSADVCGLHAWVVSTRLGKAGSAEPAETQAAEAAEAEPGGGALGLALAQWIGDGGLAVVPYDHHEADHTPVARGGGAAHYALLVGYAAPHAEAPAAEVIDADGKAEEDGSCRRPDPADEELVLIGVHGLSRAPLLATAAELRASNEQLRAMKPSAAAAGWVVGLEGPKLSGRLLLLR